MLFLWLYCCFFFVPSRKCLMLTSVPERQTLIRIRPIFRGWTEKREMDRRKKKSLGNNDDKKVVGRRNRDGNNKNKNTGKKKMRVTRIERMVSNTRLHNTWYGQQDEHERRRRRKETKEDATWRSGEEREMVKIKEKQEDRTSGNRTKRKNKRKTDSEFNTEDVKEVLGSNDARLH